MKTFTFTKAASVSLSKPIEELAIKFVGEPSDLYSLADMATVYDQEALRLAEALLGILPGGTLDRLIAHLLMIKASHFRVSF